MFRIYAIKYNPIPGSPWWNGEVLTPLFSVPFADGSEAPYLTVQFNQNGRKVYDIGYRTDEGGDPFMTTSVNCEMGNAGSFEFSVASNSIFYELFIHMRTVVVVEYDGVVIFCGRVLTIDRDMFRTKKIHCEGAFTFFMDSLYMGKKNGDQTGLDIYLQRLLTQHNTLMEKECAEKVITRGILPGTYPTTGFERERKVGIVDNDKIDVQKYGEDGYKTVKECLETVQKDYGGYMRVRCELEDYNDEFVKPNGETKPAYKGNINLNNRIVVLNSDGSYSTEDSITIEIEVEDEPATETEPAVTHIEYVVIPTIIGGQKVSDNAATEHYNTTGECLGSGFLESDDADRYANLIHERQAWYYSGKRKQMRLYLDWMKLYFNAGENNQTLSVTSNVVDQSDTVEVNNIFTHIIPVGKNNKYIDGGSSSGGGGKGDGKAYALELSVTPGNAGWVSTPIHREADGKVKSGSAVTLNVGSNHGYKFKMWQVLSGGITINNSNGFTMPTQDVSVQAVFIPDGGIPL